MSSIAEIEVEKKAYQEQFEIVLGQLRDDPDNVELKALKDELNSFIDLLSEQIAELKPAQASKPAPKQPSPPPSPRSGRARTTPPLRKQLRPRKRNRLPPQTTRSTTLS
ncbi:hypothetical protein NXS19_005068 [Fusarium pseudograminearum]|nr:hypothetical protein NXS19_005068 [Fusarium pseudograminearum]